MINGDTLRLSHVHMNDEYKKEVTCVGSRLENIFSIIHSQNIEESMNDAVFRRKSDYLIALNQDPEKLGENITKLHSSDPEEVVESIEYLDILFSKYKYSLSNDDVDTILQYFIDTPECLVDYKESLERIVANFFLFDEPIPSFLISQGILQYFIDKFPESSSCLALSRFSRISQANRDVVLDMGVMETLLDEVQCLFPRHDTGIILDFLISLMRYPLDNSPHLPIFEDILNILLEYRDRFNIDIESDLFIVFNSFSQAAESLKIKIFEYNMVKRILAQPNPMHLKWTYYFGIFVLYHSSMEASDNVNFSAQFISQGIWEVILEAFENIEFSHKGALTFAKSSINFIAIDVNYFIENSIFLKYALYAKEMDYSTVEYMIIGAYVAIINSSNAQIDILLGSQEFVDLLFERYPSECDQRTLFVVSGGIYVLIEHFLSKINSEQLLSQYIFGNDEFTSWLESIQNYQCQNDEVQKDCVVFIQYIISQYSNWLSKQQERKE